MVVVRSRVTGSGNRTRLMGCFSQLQFDSIVQNIEEVG